MTQSGEVIRVSLGSDANAISSHLVNLEGLACTNNGIGPLCDSHTTHRVIQDNGTERLVPRTLFVDDANRFGSVRTSSVDTDGSAAWSGPVESLDASITGARYAPSPAMEHYQQATHAASHRQFPSVPSQSSKHVYPKPESRHVDWDDDEYECDNDEEAQERKVRRLEREQEQQTILEGGVRAAWSAVVEERTLEATDSRMKPKQSNSDTSHAVGNAAFKATPQEMQQSSDETTAAPTTSEDKIHAPCDLDVAWHEHLLPPYPLPSSFIPLNTTTTTQQQTSYQSGIHNQQHHNLLSDAMRQLLEECDTVQGFQILTSPGGYAGLTASLLEEVRDECKSAARLTMIVEDNGNTQTSSSSHDARLAFRRRLDTGLVYHGIGTSSDVMLPLSLSSMAAGLDDQSTFEASAVAALALECSTLSYRLLDNAQRSQIALAGTGMVGCDAMFTTTPRISYRDYVASIKPSNRHTILELEARTTPLVGRSLSSWLLDGISSNGDARQRQHPWPSRTPGEWLTSPFFLQPLSFTPTPSQSALPHTFFALSSSIRPSRWDTTPNAVLDYTLPVMEGLATCRPERFSSTVVNSSIASTTRDGYAYWGTLLCRNSDRNNLVRDGLQRAPNTSIFNALNDTPIVSILGNTTKSHAHLHTKQLNFKQCLDRKSKGYWAMEQSQNSDLEYDDCIEVADYWMELDNAYYVDDGQGDTDEYYE